MKLIIPELEIDQEKPFKNDVLQRQAFGDALESIIANEESSLVIALDSPWGEGKTTFVKMWKAQLENNGFSAIYFDAFANDYVDDAFISIVSQIVSFVEDKKSNSKLKKQLTSFKKKAAKAGTHLLGWSLKLGIKALTLNVLGENEIQGLKQITSDVATDSSKTVSSFIEDSISKHIESVESIKSFKESLKEIAKTIKDETEKPLVIIIDELDRCKPTYAVDIIETIKHLFAVENTVFLLVMNREQLEESIKSIYGREIKADIYLQKFINIFCHLPKVDVYEYDERDYYNKYINFLTKKHEAEFGYVLKSELIWLAKEFSLSLRELEKCFTNFTLFYKAIPNNLIMMEELLCILCVLKIKELALYKRLSCGKVSYIEFAEFIKSKLRTNILGTLNSVGSSLDEGRSIVTLAYFLMSDSELPKYSKDSILKTYGAYNVTNNRISNNRRSKIIPAYCNYLDFFNVS